MRSFRRALALFQLGAQTAAERELFGASVDADPQYIETILAVAQKAVLPGLSIRIANAAWDQRDKIAGYDGAMYPLPPWQPLSGFALDKALVYGFMRQESAFNPKARSNVGAMGLMQLMPATAIAYGVRNAFDPAENIRAGVAYLRGLLDRYSQNEELALAAYNAGPGAVAKYGNVVPPYRETRNYVKQITSVYRKPSHPYQTELVAPSSVTSRIKRTD